jgi:hypothetical protein
MTDMTDAPHPAQTIRGRTLAQVRKHDWLKSLVLLGLVANALFFCGRAVQEPPVEKAAVQVAPIAPIAPVAPAAAKTYFDTAKFDLKADADRRLLRPN